MGSAAVYWIVLLVYNQQHMFIYTLYGLVYCSLLLYNMFSVWVLRSIFVLPSILPPYILPPKGEVFFF